MVMMRLLGMTLVAAVVTGPSGAEALRMEIPTVYVEPGGIAMVDVHLLPEGATVTGVQSFLVAEPPLAALTCRRSQSLGDPPSLRIFSVFNLATFTTPTIIETCWVQAPGEEGVYGFHVVEASVSTPPSISPPIILPPEALARGQIVVTDVVPTPTATPTRLPGPAVCGDGKLQEDEECDDFNAVGGDGCAANCTVERRRSIAFAPGACVGGPSEGAPCVHSIDCPGGDCAGTVSRATFQSRSLGLNLPLAGEQTLVMGRPRETDTYGADGEVRLRAGDIPFLIRREDATFAPVPVPGLACACVRYGWLYDRRDAVVANGVIHCGAEGGEQVDYELFAERDISERDPECAEGIPMPDGRCALLPERPTFTAGGPEGSAVMEVMLSTAVIIDGGSCCRAGVDPGCAAHPLKGDDGLPCTDDDMGVARPEVPTVFTTGGAFAGVVGADGTEARIAPGSGIPCRESSECGDADELCFDQDTLFECAAASAECACGVDCNARQCVSEAQGAVFDCDALRHDGENIFAGGRFVVAQPGFDGPVGDQVITAEFAPIRFPTASALSPTPTRTPTPMMPSTWTPTRTATPTETGPSRTPTPTLTPTPPLPPCVGSCFVRPQVRLDSEVRLATEVALGGVPLRDCQLADADGDGLVTVDELLLAVQASRSRSCDLGPDDAVPPTPTPPILDCIYDCFGEGYSNLRRMMSDFEAGDGRPPFCRRELRDGLLDVMAAIQDSLFGCRIVNSDYQCTDERRGSHFGRLGISMETWPADGACPLP